MAKKAECVATVLIYGAASEPDIKIRFNEGAFPKIRIHLFVIPSNAI